MMPRNLTISAALVGLALLVPPGIAVANPLSCTVDEDIVTVDSASACATTPDQNDSKAVIDTLVFNPGPSGPFSWTFLDKDNRSTDLLLNNENNQIAGANEDWFTGSITDPGSQRNGTFTVDVASFFGLGGYNLFALYIKPGNDGVYFLLDGTVVNGILSGTFKIEGVDPPPPGHAISHMSLYGRVDDVPPPLDPPPGNPVPEPASLAMLGLGLCTLRVMRRRPRA